MYSVQLCCVGHTLVEFYLIFCKSCTVLIFVMKENERYFSEWLHNCIISYFKNKSALVLSGCKGCFELCCHKFAMFNFQRFIHRYSLGCFVSNVDSLSLLYLWVKKVLWIVQALLSEVNDLNLFPLSSKFTDVEIHI